MINVVIDLYRGRKFLDVLLDNGAPAVEDEHYRMLGDSQLETAFHTLYVIHGDLAAVRITRAKDGDIDQESEYKEILQSVVRPLNVHDWPERVWKKALSHAHWLVKERWKFIEAYGDVDVLAHLISNALPEGDKLRGVVFMDAKRVNALLQRIADLGIDTPLIRAVLAATVQRGPEISHRSLLAAYVLGRLGVKMPECIAE